MVHRDEARHEVVPRAAHGAALVLLVVVVVGVPAPDADAERAVLAAAAAPELAAGGDEERVVPPRGERHHGLVEVLQRLHEARPRHARLPPRGGGEGDVAESELTVAARAPGPHRAALGEAQRVRAPGDGVRDAHAPQRIQTAQRAGVVEVPVAELPVAPAAARPEPPGLGNRHRVVGARRDLRHPRRRHAGDGARHVNLDGRPAAVPELARGREPPGEQRAVGRERGAVRRAAAHRLQRGGVRESGDARQRNRVRTRRVVVAPLPELAVEPATERVQRAPARLGPHEALALAGGGNRGDSRGVARQRTPRVGTAETRAPRKPRDRRRRESPRRRLRGGAQEVARVRALRSIRVERSRNTFHTEHGGVERAEIEAGGGPQRDVRARREMKNFSAVGLLAERDARDDAIRAGVRVYASLGDALDDPTLPEQFADARHHAELACAAAEQNLFQHLGRQDPQRADSAGAPELAESRRRRLCFLELTVSGAPSTRSLRGSNPRADGSV